eukprot:TRINITY_DN30944_c0_g1_i1.p1 TRINITY_DN30944_c0_g1~~TRINITY_DN30944_c0_g1_i1.p1  ORF type:complete len:533 (+),score=104.20 TRINITY_DN30944_c0_g1_i1:90-1601(+)
MPACPRVRASSRSRSRTSAIPRASKAVDESALTSNVADECSGPPDGKRHSPSKDSGGDVAKEEAVVVPVVSDASSQLQMSRTEDAKEGLQHGQADVDPSHCPTNVVKQEAPGNLAGKGQDQGGGSTIGVASDVPDDTKDSPAPKLCKTASTTTEDSPETTAAVDSTKTSRRSSSEEPGEISGGSSDDDASASDDDSDSDSSSSSESDTAADDTAVLPQQQNVGVIMVPPEDVAAELELTRKAMAQAGMPVMPGMQGYSPLYFQAMQEMHYWHALGAAIGSTLSSTSAPPPPPHPPPPPPHLPEAGGKASHRSSSQLQAAADSLCPQCSRRCIVVGGSFRCGFHDLAAEEMYECSLWESSGSQDPYAMGQFECFLGNLVPGHAGKRFLEEKFNWFFSQLPSLFELYPSSVSRDGRAFVVERTVLHRDGRSGIIRFANQAFASTAVLMDGIFIHGRRVNIRRPNHFGIPRGGVAPPLDVSPLRRMGLLQTLPNGKRKKRIELDEL